MITFRTETILNQGIHDHTMRDRLGICNTDKVCGAEMGAVVPVITLALVLYHDVGSVVATYLVNLFWGDTYRELRIREGFIDDFLLSLVFFVGLFAHILLYFIRINFYLGGLVNHTHNRRPHTSQRAYLRSALGTLTLFQLALTLHTDMVTAGEVSYMHTIPSIERIGSTVAGNLRRLISSSTISVTSAGLYWNSVAITKGCSL
jgi:hypothetical protein